MKEDIIYCITDWLLDNLGERDHDNGTEIVGYYNNMEELIEAFKKDISPKLDEIIKEHI